MRSSTLCTATLALSILALPSSALGEFVEWELEGTISLVGVSGAGEEALAPLTELGIVEGSSVRARYVIDTGTPAEQPAPSGEQVEFLGAVRAVEVRMGDLLLVGGAALDESRLFLRSVAATGRSSFQLLVRDLESAEDFEVRTFSVLQFLEGLVPLEIPDDPPEPSGSGRNLAAIFLQPDGVVTLVFDIDSFRRVDAAAPGARGEPLLGYLPLPGRGDLLFLVGSNGCTRRRDFRVDVTGSDPARLLLVRERPDPCRGISRAVPIRIRLPELGLEPGDTFVVTNRLGVQTLPEKERRGRRGNR